MRRPGRAVASVLGLAASRFAHRNYRLFFAGQAVSLVGTWMQPVAQAWLVLQLTAIRSGSGSSRRPSSSR